MKKLLTFISLFFLTLSAASSSNAAAERAPEESAGHLSPDSCCVDLGVIRGDTIAEGRLGFRNTGDVPLQILSIFSDCGCTSSDYTKDSVEPGGSGEIRIRFNPKGRTPGPFRKALRIRSTADNPRVVVTVKGEVGKDG